MCACVHICLYAAGSEGRGEREGWIGYQVWTQLCLGGKVRSVVIQLMRGLHVREAWRDLTSIALISITNIMLMLHASVPIEVTVPLFFYAFVLILFVFSPLCILCAFYLLFTLQETMTILLDLKAIHHSSDFGHHHSSSNFLRLALTIGSNCAYNRVHAFTLDILLQDKLELLEISRRIVCISGE